MNQRFYSLDVFRGATVALMILVNNPGNWSYIYSPLEHAPWHGCTPTDLVFPFFLFAVGNALAFVMPKLEAAGTPVFFKKVITRTLLIFAIGLFLNWFPFFKWSNNGDLVFKFWVDPENKGTGIRLLGVLQRIALCYFFASIIIYFSKPRTAFIIGLTLLVVYWLLCRYLGTAGDPYSLAGWFGTDIDKQILGVAHMYKGEGVPFDPEGLMSTLPAIVQVIFGYLAGYYIRKQERNYQMLSTIMVSAALLIFAGFCWDTVFPINKKIWTSSYVLYTTGLALMTLSVLIYFVEFKKITGAWTNFFDAFGKNPLFIFVLSGLLPRLSGLIRWVDHTTPDGKKEYTTFFPWFYEHICKPVSGNLKIGSLLYAIITILVYYMIAYWLNKKRIYIRV